MSSRPRRHSELTEQSTTTSSTKADYTDYDAMAEILRQPRHPWKVFKSGSNYGVLDPYGRLSLAPQSSLETAIVDEAIAGLTASRTIPETIEIIGDCTLDAQVLYPSYVDFSIDGRIKAANGLNASMFKNANQSTFNIHTTFRGKGGRRSSIEGNSANQTTGTRHIIDHVNATDPSSDTYGHTPRALQVLNLSLLDAYHEALFVDLTGSLSSTIRVFNTTGISAARNGAMLIAVFDSELKGGLWEGNSANFGYNTGPEYHSAGQGSPVGAGIALQSCSMCTIKPFYVNSPIYSYASHNMLYHIEHFDHRPYYHGLTLQYSSNNRVLGTYFHIAAVSGGTTNTYSAVYLWNQSTENKILNCGAGRSWQDTTSEQWKFAVEESNSNCDYNLISNIHGIDCATNAVRKLGTNSVVPSATIVGGITTS